jgi:hypothetical protein
MDAGRQNGGGSNGRTDGPRLDCEQIDSMGFQGFNNQHLSWDLEEEGCGSAPAKHVRNGFALVNFNRAGISV